MEHRETTTARAICTIGDRVLLSRAVGEQYCILPGGHVEAGEEPSMAVRRELQEELGRSVGDLVFLGVLENVFDRGGVREHESMYLYRATLTTTAYDHLPESKEGHLQCAWVPIHCLREVNLLPPALDAYILRYGA